MLARVKGKTSGQSSARKGSAKTRSVGFRLGVLAVVGVLVVMALAFFGRKNPAAGADAAADAPADVAPATSTSVAVADAQAAPVTATTDAAPEAAAALASVSVLATQAGDTAEDASNARWSLEGVDLERRRAWVRHERTKPTPLFEIVTIDYDKAPPAVERWVAKDDAIAEWATLLPEGTKAGYPPALHALAGALEDDAAKYGEIVRRSGPWFARPRALAPTFAASSDAMVWGAVPTDKTDGDWLMAAGKDGKGAKRFDVGMTASYDPVFAPDGKRVAWRGCGKKCDYYVYLASFPSGAPVKVTSVAGPRGAPLFSADGKQLYVASRGAGDKGGCLWRVEVDKPDAATKLHCMADAFTDVEAVLDEHAETALVCGKRADGGALECAWLALPDGASKGSLKPSARVAVVSRGGLGLGAIAGGVRAWDLATGDARDWTGVDLELSTARFATDGELVALRRDGAGASIVRVDVRKLLAELPKAP